MTKFVMIALAFLAVAGCAAVPEAPQPPDPKVQMTALENRIAALIEEQRLKLDPNAKPLALDPELAGIARARAGDMAAMTGALKKISKSMPELAGQATALSGVLASQMATAWMGGKS